MDVNGWTEQLLLWARQPGTWALLALLLVIALALVLGITRRRRLRDVAAALDGSSAGSFVPGPEQRGGLGGEILPAPDPFVRLFVEFTMPMARGQQVVLRGETQGRIVNELVWMRGRAPGRALGRGGGGELWAARTLEVLHGEYAVRGSNTAALEKTFADLQTRFGAESLAVTVQAAQPNVIVAISFQGIEARELSAVVALARALGRAALRA